MFSVLAMIYVSEKNNKYASTLFIPGKFNVIKYQSMKKNPTKVALHS